MVRTEELRAEHRICTDLGCRVLASNTLQTSRKDVSEDADSIS